MLSILSAFNLGSPVPLGFTLSPLIFTLFINSFGFDISNVHISQDDLWLLYRLKFGTSTRNKRSVLLPQFTEEFNKNLKEMKK